MKQWNFRHLNTNSEKITVTVKCFGKKTERFQKSQQYYFVWYIKNFSDIFRQFRLFLKTSKDFRRFLRTSKDPKITETVRYSQRHPKTRILSRIGRNKRLQPPLSTRSEFRSDYSFRFSKNRKELSKYGVTVLVSALRGHDFKFFVLVAREMFETWTTVKNPHDTAKTDNESYENLKPVCLSRL